MKPSQPLEMADYIAEPQDHIQVEIWREVGVNGAFKLYVSFNGQTVPRVCKLRKEQILPANPTALEVLRA